MSPVLKDRKLSIPLKVRLLKCFIWSVLLYGCESWTLSAALTRNIEATEMWFYRRMLRVSYTAHETNISVLQRMGQERQLLRTIKERQTSFTGHIIRKGELEDLILAGKVQGKKARGGQRLLFLNQVMKNTGLTSPRTIWDAARNRTLKIKTPWVVKGRIDQGTEEREHTWTWKENHRFLYSAISEMRQFCQNRTWSAAAILDSKHNDSCYIYNNMSTILIIRSWKHGGGTKNEASILNDFRDMTIFRNPTWRR